MKLIPFLISVAAALALLVSASEALADRTPGEPAQGLYVFDPSNASLKLLVAGEEDDPAWSPNGRWIQAFDADDYFTHIVDPSGAVRHRAGSVSWSGDGSSVAYTSTGNRTQNLFVGPADWSAPKLVMKNTGDPLAWAPDSRRFVFSTGSALDVAA